MLCYKQQPPFRLGPDFKFSFQKSEICSIQAIEVFHILIVIQGIKFLMNWPSHTKLPAKFALFFTASLFFHDGILTSCISKTEWLDEFG